MATNKTIEINVKVNGLDTIKGQVDDLATQLKEIGDIELITDEAGNKIKKITKNVEDLGKSAKKTSTSIGDIAKGFGLIKIGEAILGKLSDLFMENETIARAMEIATRALSIVFKDFFNFISNNISVVVKFFKETFENPQKLLKEFGVLIKENIEERISSAIDLFGYLASSVKKVFSGDFTGAMDDAKKAGKEFVDVQTGINNSVDRAIDTVGKVANAVADYTKKVTDNAKAQIDAEKSAKIASALAKGRVADLEAEAEKLRQVRDNTLLSVADRIKANDELKGKLEELRKAKLAETSADILIAKNALALNATTENKIALINAESAAKQANADITGQLSEQEQNRSNLAKEAIALNQTAIDGIAERSIEQKEFNDSQIENDLLRLQSERKTLDETEKIALQELTTKRDSYKLGTQEYVDANEEILNTQQDFGNKKIAKEKEISEEEKKIAKENAEAIKEIAEKKQQALDVALQQGSASLSQASELLGEATDAGKASAIASASIDTFQSANASYKALAGIPVVGPGLGTVAAGIAVAAGLANVKKILAVKTPKGGGGGSVPSAGSKPLTPSFNLNGQNNNQNTQSTKTTEVKPNQEIIVKAYVSETDITKSQAFVKTVTDSAKI